MVFTIVSIPKTGTNWHFFWVKRCNFYPFSVYVNKKKIRLGRTGTPEADDAFRRVQIQVLTDPTYEEIRSPAITDQAERAECQEAQTEGSG